MPNKVQHGKRYYKQMALEVAVRNPERYEAILRTFAKFEGEKLSDENILDIYAQLYIDGVVISNDIIDIDYVTHHEIKTWIAKTRTHNNEWGYPTGYQAAFVRYLKTLSEFGFIYSQYQDYLLLSPVAKALLNRQITLSEAFAVQSMRHWRKSPYRRVLNDFNYFDFFMSALKEYAPKKISYPQFMYSLFSDNGDVDDYISTIRKVKIGSDEQKAYALVRQNYDNRPLCAKVSKLQTAFRDYGNTVFRVLQLTGFITVSYEGVILLSLNKSRRGLYEALHDLHFVISEEAKEDELTYFQEIGSFSDELLKIVISNRETAKAEIADYNKKIAGVIKSYNLNKELTGKYMLGLCGLTKDKDPFWFIQDPVKFEFFLTIYAYLTFGDKFEYRPNYLSDEEGIPYSHAPGNMGDIEIYNDSLYWLIEATLIRNKNQQINNETVNLFRHIDAEQVRDKYLTLVAPYIHDDTKLIFNVATLIRIMQSRKINFSSRAETTDEFINSIKEDYFNTLKANTLGFIAEIKTILNTIR